MNCKSCIQQMEPYLEGNMPDRARIQVEEHLASCEECTVVYRTWTLADRIMNEEKTTLANPFLASRIMASIEQMDDVRANRRNPFLQRVLKPVLVSASIAAAAFFGVLSGSLYQTDSANGTFPVELSYLNDATLESVDFYTTN